MPHQVKTSCEKNDNASSDEKPYHKFQIGHPSGMIWESGNAHLHGNVKLINSVANEHWRVEKEELDPFWSFHVLSNNNEKLYVSYDDSSNDITLEFKDDSEGGKKRYFVLVLQKNMGYVLRAQDSIDRYVRSNKGKLEMITSNEPIEDMQWLIEEDFDKIEGQDRKHNVEIRHTAQKWISHEAYIDQPIPVAQTGKIQNWGVCMTSGVLMFSVGTEPAYFASCSKLDKGVIFNELKEVPGMGKYVPKWQGFGCKLQNISSSDWITVSTETNANNLVRDKDERHAIVWEILELGIQYKKCDDYFMFPPAFY